MSSDKPSLPYVVKYPWFMKLMVLFMLGIMVLILFPNPRPVVLELWEQENTVFRFCMLFSAVMIPAGMAEISFFRLVFSESGIEKRTKFLTKKFIPTLKLKEWSTAREPFSNPHFS